MIKENVHIEKVSSESVLKLYFKPNENSGVGLVLRTDMEPEIQGILQRIFKINGLEELTGKQAVLAKKEGERRILALGNNNGEYIYKKGKEKIRLVDELQLQSLINTDLNKRKQDDYGNR